MKNRWSGLTALLVMECQRPLTTVQKEYRTHTPVDVWPTFTHHSCHGFGGYSKLINRLIGTATGVFVCYC